LSRTSISLTRPPTLALIDTVAACAYASSVL
jgi:hypothetical protein